MVYLSRWYNIDNMKEFLVHLLILIMLTPGLACGPFMGKDRAQAAQTMQSMEDCHGIGMASQKQPPDSGHMFFKDCSKTDLFNASHVVLEQPNLDSNDFFIAWTNIVPAYIFSPANFQAIRGPPPEWPDLSQALPSILLTTQRFRE